MDNLFMCLFTEKLYSNNISLLVRVGVEIGDKTKVIILDGLSKSSSNPINFPFQHFIFLIDKQ